MEGTTSDNGEVSTEIDRRERVYDMMLSAHAALRDRYRLLALLLSLTIFFFSTILLALTFVSPDMLAGLGVHGERTSFWLGLSAAGVFFLSIVDLCVRWRERSRAHADAAVRLAAIKSEVRGLKTQTGLADAIRDTAFREFDIITRDLIPIPESDFLRLKARHERKVEVSRLLSKSPGCPW